MVTNNRILLINDDEPISRYLGDKLINEAGYSVTFEYTGFGGLNTFKENSFEVVIGKFDMPDLDGTSLIKDIKKIDPDCIFIALIEEENPVLLKEISELGVYGFITKPVNLEKLFLLIEKGMQLRLSLLARRKLTESFSEQKAALQKQNILLAKRIEESAKNLTRLYEDLRSTYMRTIRTLACAIDARDHYTHKHSENVAKYAVAIASEMYLPTKEIETIREACELHDIGKIGIQDNILNKSSALTAEEWKQVKHHPTMGAQILEPLTFLNEVIDLIRQHHENYDGSGYSEGRSGNDIILGARIIHLADAFDSMRSERSYRKVPFSKEEAILEIMKNSGTQFDPKVVEAFLRTVDRL